MSPSIRHFTRHYIEMVIAMILGMIVLGLPAEAALRAMGTSTTDLRGDAPVALLLGMATTMTVPMVAWMRHRGHDWQPSAEMAASMYVPTFAAVALLGAGTVTEVGTLLTIQHGLMFPAMLVAMLLRRDEYNGAAHRAHAAQAEVTA